MSEPNPSSLYVHYFDIAFSVVSDKSEGEAVSFYQLVAAAQERLTSLLKQAEEGLEDLEAFGLVDSYIESHNDPTYKENLARFESQTAVAETLQRYNSVAKLSC